VSEDLLNRVLTEFVDQAARDCRCLHGVDSVGQLNLAVGG